MLRIRLCHEGRALALLPTLLHYLQPSRGNGILYAVRFALPLCPQVHLEEDTAAPYAQH